MFERPIDPRTKLVLSVAVIGAVFVTRRPAVLALECVLIALVLLPAVGKNRWRQVLRPVWPITLMVLIIGLLFFDAITAITLTVRLFNLLAAGLLVFQWMPPEQLGDGLRKLAVPYGVVFMVTTAMRYVPLIGRKVRNIRDAQLSRGIDLRFRLRNLVNLVALFVPLLVQSFVLADDLALAMESRGFSRKGRSMRRNYRLGFVDGLLMVAALVGLALLWWTERRF